MRVAHVLTLLLIVAVALLAGALSQRLSISADWTAGNRNSLTEASERVIAALHDGPITLRAYIYPGPQRADVRLGLDRAEALLEAREVREPVRVDEVEQRPQLARVVLQRRAREQQPELRRAEPARRALAPA